MSATDQSWFTEAHEGSGSSIGFRTRARLHAEQTPFQSIEIHDSTDWGKLMVIDGCMMLTTRDNFFYHEMMSHPALFTHPRARRVVIIGGATAAPCAKCCATRAWSPPCRWKLTSG